MTITPQLVLAQHFKVLRLPTFLHEYDKAAKQCAVEGFEHFRFLLRLAEPELIDREWRMVDRQIKAANLPPPKVSPLGRLLRNRLPGNRQLRFQGHALVEQDASDGAGALGLPPPRNENIIAAGNSGTGKSHIALGLGLAACQKFLAVGFITASALVHELLEARDEKRLLRL